MARLSFGPIARRIIARLSRPHVVLVDPEPTGGAVAVEPLETIGQPGAPIVSTGAVVRDFEVSDQYPGAIRRTTDALSLMPGGGCSQVMLNVFPAKRVALTSCYLPIDLDHGRLFINQSYEGIIDHWNPRPRLTQDGYTFRAEAPIVITRRAVIIGGPIELSYYHWVLNWLSRLAILKMLSPETFRDPGTAILVDIRAQRPPFIDFLQASGIDPSRFIWVDHRLDYLVEDAVLVSFGNQHANYPEVLKVLGDMFRPMGAAVGSSPHGRRLWISRQALGPSRRRIDNIEDIRPILRAYGFEEVVLEGLSIAEQVGLFADAEVVAGVHGAGFANIIFSPPDCKVLVVESDLNIRLGVSRFYSVLAQACGLAYENLKAKRAPMREAVEHIYANAHNQDLIVSPQALDAALSRLLAVGDA